jgi:hypothetical protein
MQLPYGENLSVLMEYTTIWFKISNTGEEIFFPFMFERMGRGEVKVLSFLATFI